MGLVSLLIRWPQEGVSPPDSFLQLALQRTEGLVSPSRCSDKWPSLMRTGQVFLGVRLILPGPRRKRERLWGCRLSTFSCRHIADSRDKKKGAVQQLSAKRQGGSAPLRSDGLCCEHLNLLAQTHRSSVWEALSWVCDLRLEAAELQSKLRRTHTCRAHCTLPHLGTGTRALNMNASVTG